MRKLITLLLALPFYCYSQQNPVWHGIERSVHYLPEGKDFVLANGQRKFNRGLYGGNTGFRVEAGDLPEFAMYLPGMGGNLKFGLIANGKSKWLTTFDKIQSRYRPGSMIYQLEDSLLENGKLNISAMAIFEKEGMLIKIETKQLKNKFQLLAAYGGATGLKFSRDGDIGADPESSFYLQPAYCSDNILRIHSNSFELLYGSKKPLSESERYEIQNSPLKGSADSSKQHLKTITGIFPSNCMLQIADANMQGNPKDFFQSQGEKFPALAAIMDIAGDSTYYFLIQPGGSISEITYADIKAIWERAELNRKQIADRVEVLTPDPFINTLGGALSVAADAIWEDPSFMHGAIAWRMRLNGWRGAYVADVLGWHDRAKKHFSSYALSQLNSPVTAPIVMDTALHLARGLEKLGTSMFSSGYISRNPNGDFRPHHYDMNLVFVDQLLNHFQWTGDTGFIRKSWPLLKRHIEWEKRNFDVDGDGLYDSYAAIWASDALQYGGGGVTHSSAYNYRTNLMMVRLAILIGEDPTPYHDEANRILNAINQQLWLKDQGWYAEFRDLLGNKLLHSNPGLWTIYHSTDSKITDRFQAYQLLEYVNNNIPHIPIQVKGISDNSLYTLSTTNWQPYTWSLNNVALAELMHTALSFWQAGKFEEAYKLWRSSLIESMYIGTSPGNLQQLSFYDAIRGELYRDFADPIAMTARSLVEGLFGVYPDALKDTLFVQPGLPNEWQNAQLSTPDFKLSFHRNQNADSYTILNHFPSKMHLSMRIKTKSVKVEAVTINGRSVLPKYDSTAVGFPELMLQFPHSDSFHVNISWSKIHVDTVQYKRLFIEGEDIAFGCKSSTIKEIYDPQGVLNQVSLTNKKVTGTIKAKEGNHCFFIRLQQSAASWWQPINVIIEKPVTIRFVKENNSTSVVLRNNSKVAYSTKLSLNNRSQEKPGLLAGKEKVIILSTEELLPGTNRFYVYWNSKVTSKDLLDWSIPLPDNIKFEKVDISRFFNEEVNNIFKLNYLSPRPVATTLQLPTQGIGNWAYPLTNAKINDSVFRSRIGNTNEFRIKAGIPFFTPGDYGKKNIAFTSQWDNFPDSINVPLTGKSSHAYFLMAGSTNPMQSRIINGEIYVRYTDGSVDRLELKNPENWWPIEQDYYVDGFAFTTDAPRPLRVYFKDGLDSMEYGQYESIRGFSNFAVKNGAATVLDLPLSPTKELKELVVKTIANDVVIGLMSVTLIR